MVWVSDCLNAKIWEDAMRSGTTREWVMAAVVATLTGCATGPTLYPVGERPPMAAEAKDTAAKGFPTVEGQALLYLYRSGAEPEVYQVTIDNIQECALWPGTFFVFAVKPGTHQIHAEDIRIYPPSGVTTYISEELAKGPIFSAEPSKNYYLKISSAPFPKAKVELVADEATAQADIRRCGLITSWKYQGR